MIQAKESIPEREREKRYMRIGRTGTFKTASGKVGTAAVVAITSADTLVAKDAITGQLIRFNRGEFNCFNSCGMNPNAANLVREATGVSESGTGYGSGRGYGSYASYDAEPEGTVALAEFDFGTTAMTPSLDFELGIKQIKNKKRVTAIPAALAAALRPLLRGKSKSVKASRKASAKR